MRIPQRKNIQKNTKKEKKRRNDIMYSWGDDTNTWKNPGAYDYGSARKPYLDALKKDADDKGPRAYSKKKEPNFALVDPKGKEITTQSTNPVVIAVDGTGSMQTWPAEIFDRLPLLYQTLSKYRPDMEISFSVIGDATADNWPVQISSFGKGPTLDDYLKGLTPEGGGGGGMKESYELWGYYVNMHVTTPKATSPFLIMMGDEKFYEKIDPKQVNAYLGDTIQAPLDAVDMWKALSQKFNIYLLRKSYAGADEQIKGQWATAIGEEKIIPVTDPTRVVDVAIGIIAKHWGEYGDFKKSMKARQDDAAIAIVEESLRAAPITPDPANMNSKLTTPSASKKSKKLL